MLRRLFPAAVRHHRHHGRLRRTVHQFVTKEGHYYRSINSIAFSNDTSKHTAKNNDHSTITLTEMIEPLGKLLSTVRIFQTGLSKLKVDFYTAIYIQDVELTHLHLQRRIRRDYEQHRQKLRLHERHGIHVVDGASGKEVAFYPSTSFDIHHYNNNHHHTHPASNIANLQASPPSSITTQRRRRRPQEHLRQLSRDLQTTLPTVAGFFIPFVGYSFIFLGMMFPRLLLSRQFHTEDQRNEFAMDEYGQRLGWYRELNESFWGWSGRRMPGLASTQTTTTSCNNYISAESLESLSYQRMDAAGPVFSGKSLLTLYNLLRHANHPRSNGSSTASSSPSASTEKVGPCIKDLQRSHLHSLALSNNLASPILLPSTIAPYFLQACLPMPYLQHKLTTLSESIIMDDAALIEESQLYHECSGMTDQEVLEACWLRGLPVGRFVKNAIAAGGANVGSEVSIMRKILTNHLQMMQTIMAYDVSSTISTGNESVSLRSKGDLVRDCTLQLLVLHLPAIRYGIMMEAQM